MDCADEFLLGGAKVRRLHMKRMSGFSLVELLITITIVAILVALAVPNYRVWTANTRVRGAAESIQNGIRLARNEATQRGVNVRFELTSTDTTWQVCQLAVTATACDPSVPASIIEVHAAGETAGVIVSTDKTVAALTNFSPVTGSPPGGITFTPLARPLSSDFGSNALIRIDTSSSAAGTRRLATTISAGGSIQMCDAGLSRSTAANGCL
ncbi:type IV fimbrial biogenesis protein FimT [Luteibacter sp. PvP120]